MLVPPDYGKKIASAELGKYGDDGQAVVYAPQAPLLPVNVIKGLVESFPWHGSHFPKDECFEKLKGQVTEDRYEELKQAIAARAIAYNSTLE